LLFVWLIEVIVVLSEVTILLHPFNCLFSRTTWVSRYQKGKTSLDLNEARDDGVLGWQWHQLDHMQTTAPRSRQITTPTPYQSIFTGRMLFLTPTQQCQSTMRIEDHCEVTLSQPKQISQISVSVVLFKDLFM